MQLCANLKRLCSWGSEPILLLKIQGGSEPHVGGAVDSWLVCLTPDQVVQV